MNVQDEKIIVNATKSIKESGKKATDYGEKNMKW